MFDTLDTAPPDASLGLQLEQIDRESISGEELVALMKARSRLISHLQAEFYADMAAVADAAAKATPFVGYEYAGDEIAAALTWTRRAADAQLGLAWELAELPQVRRALSTGEIDLPKAKTIVYGLTGVDREVATEVAEKILEKAEAQTTGQIRSRLRRLTITANPEAATDRYRVGLHERKVVLEANDDGTATIHGLNLPPDRAVLAFNRVDQYAWALATADDPRSLDQIRADVLLDLLLGCEEHQDLRGRKPVVDLKVELTTLMELNEHPGEIPGFGPVISDIARQVVETQKSEWRFIVVDDDQIVCQGITRRRPSRVQRRRIETRHPHCVFPGCRRPSTHADIDHVIRYVDGGPTEDFNLDPLCEHHHGSKDTAGWHLEVIDPHTFEWTSPLGLKYLVEIEPP